jgi:hypothetical protein
MKSSIYIPRSLAAAGRHLRRGFACPVEKLSKTDFIRAWCSLAYLYPGLHPDGFEHPDSGWPRALKRFAAEAWRRVDIGEITDNELYCYQACKARIRRERAEVERMFPWRLRDHFAV